MSRLVSISEDVIDGLDMLFQCFSENIIDYKKNPVYSKFGKQETFDKLGAAMEWILELTEKD